MSSYKTHRYDRVFRAITTTFRPKTAVELGILDGYSTIAIGEGIKLNDILEEGKGRLIAYDLFDDYPYRHGVMSKVLQRIEDDELTDYITIKKGNAFEVHIHFEAEQIDLLHVDISNTGDTLKRIMEIWDQKVAIGGIILFEGGTEERDRVEWMLKYDAAPIKKELETNPIVEKRYVFATYLEFPGLICLLKKR